jgi:phage terminase large subunit-like protein
VVAKPPPMKSGTPRLSEIARHVVVPSGITSTGWPAVRDKCAELDIDFDSWQDGAGRLILSKRADGLYATTVGGVVISIPRQVGKTFLIGAIVFALCLLVPNLTVIWTAHRLRTAAETFSAMQSFARRRKIKPHVSKIVLGSGDEEVQFHNGSRILFGARERGFGRGFSGVDVLVFDEAQILTENAIDDMVPATNQAPNPLILFTGTPPKPTDPGEVFRLKRTEALSGGSDDTVYIEFSADLGADPMDREQWAKANPSFPTRTPTAAMLRMKKNLSEDSFLREGLGIWDENQGGEILPLDLWGSLAAGNAEPIRPVYAVEINLDRSHAWIGEALPGDERIHVQLIDSQPGTDWLLERLVHLGKTYRAPVVYDASTEAASLVPDLEAAGVKVVKLGGTDRPAACATFHDLAVQSRLSHNGDPDVTAAVVAARWKDVGEGARVFTRRKSAGEIGPLYAVALAAWACARPQARTFWGGVG